ncbi:MAG: peptide chain release factor 1 [Deltaproteobacteria bacterium]|nr:peptide chain release factor 1 [Deltaproteobacteria bacterium]
MADWTEQIRQAEERSTELESRLADPEVARNPPELARLGKELADLRPLLEAGRAWTGATKGIADAREMLAEDDPDMRELAEAELAELEAKLEELEGQIRLLLVPKDPNDGKDAILEIRAGTGGDEAALFAGDLFRMYSRYAEARGWKIEPIGMSESDGGGIKEAVVSIAGSGAFGRLKYEKGVHRVQRVPATESQGRIHTSTVTVAIMPEAEEVDIEVDPSDLRVDVFRSSGPGGQSVNTTDSAVRITHEPTGVVVTCQDEKSQHKNKAKAMKVLRSRLLEAELERQHSERADERRAQVGSGERSEKIRTYNYPQNRITDHRAGLTLHKLEACMEGDIDELLDGVHGSIAEKLNAALSEGAAA